MRRLPLPSPGRRGLLLAAACAPLLPRKAFAADEAAGLLARGNVYVLFRHAQAPGTFDPPGFRLDDCSTQRNLDDEGRGQAKRLGEWFKARSLDPVAVRSSPWCRCLDTARGAFGRATAWPALGSPSGLPDAERRTRTAELRRTLAQPLPGRFEVWVTHQFVIADLVGEATGSGAGVLLEAGSGRLLARLPAG